MKQCDAFVPKFATVRISSDSIKNAVESKLPSVLASTSMMTLVPLQQAHAADGGTLAAFSTPLIISVLTMIPFIYYTQALQKKKVKVKQIPLDDQLREVKKKPWQK